MAHITACHPWLDAELVSVTPQVIVCLGTLAGRSVLGRPVRIGEERVRLLDPTTGTHDARVLVSSHP